MDKDRELIDAVLQTFERSGFMRKLQTQIRCEIIENINNEESYGEKTLISSTLQSQSLENDLVFHLILEYLDNLKLSYTACVLKSEYGKISTQVKDRLTILKELHLKDEEANNDPLLVQLVQKYRTNLLKNENETHTNNITESINNSENTLNEKLSSISDNSGETTELGEKLISESPGRDIIESTPMKTITTDQTYIVNQSAENSTPTLFNQTYEMNKSTPKNIATIIEEETSNQQDISSS